MIRIRGGRLIDPANGIDAVTDLWLDGGKVVSVGEPPRGAENAVILEAEGRIVCPGFVDMHMHEDPLGEDGKIRRDIFDCMLRMGVTTAAGGNCGECKAEPASYLDIVDRDGAPVNVAMFAGHGYFRRAAGVKSRYDTASPEQRKRIAESIRTALDRGCVGVSFGLRYDPGTDEEELHEAARAASGTGKLLAAHVRDDAEAIFRSIAEMAEAAETAGLPVQISHIGSMAGFGQMKKVLGDLRAFRAAGLDMGMDCYPYDAFSTNIGSATYDDGWLERYGCGYDVLEFCSGPWKGKRADAETFAEMRKRYPESLTVCHVMRREEVSAALRDPLVAIASDGILNNGCGHPRAAGTFPRYLSALLEENADLSEGIRKITALPASRLGISDRKGHLGVGADADVVVFDPLRLKDRATFASPTLPPDGICAVIVGGKHAAEDGVIVCPDAGRSVRI